MKKKLFNILTSETYGPPLVFFILVLFFFAIPFAQPGTFLGGDWSLPYTNTQLKTAISNYTSSWLEVSSLVGNYQSYLTDVPLIVPFGIAALLGLSGGVIAKLYLLGTFTLAATAMYRLLRFLSLSKHTSYIGGLLYITSPFFFNYTTMGWVNVLFAMALYPFFIKSVLNALLYKNSRSAIIAGLLWALAMLQSTSIFWFGHGLAVCIASTVKTKKDIGWAVRVTGSIGVLLILLHSYWLINLIRVPDPIIYGSGNVLSGISLGTWAKLSFWNLVKGWGSLFNYSYEHSYVGLLGIISFITPVLALASLWLKRKVETPKLPFILLYITPFLFYFAGPETISILPLSNIIRDIARMTVLMSFSLTVLACITLDRLFETRRRTLYIILGTALLLNAHPFWLGNLWGDKVAHEDIRLRNYEFSQEQLEVESYLTNKDDHFKVLYIPFNQGVNDFSKAEFNGPYNEITSVFPTYSQHPGRVALTDKDTGGLNTFYTQLQQSLESGDNAIIGSFLENLNVRYLVFTHNYMTPTDWEIKNNIESLNFMSDVTQKVTTSQPELTIYENTKHTQEVIGTNEVIHARLHQENSAHISSVLSRVNGSQTTLFEDPGDTSYIPPGGYHDQLARNITNSTWHPGWGWPAETHTRGTLGYSLMRTQESLRVITTRDTLEKIDRTLWHTVKRAQELARDSAGETAEKDLLVSINSLFTLFSDVPKEVRNNDYYDLLIKTYHYFGRIESEFNILEPSKALSKWLQQEQETLAEKRSSQEIYTTEEDLLAAQEVISRELAATERILIQSDSAAVTPLSYHEIGQLLITEKHPLQERLTELVQQAATQDQTVPQIYHYSTDTWTQDLIHTLRITPTEDAVILLTQDIESISEEYIPNAQEKNIVTSEVVTSIREIRANDTFIDDITPGKYARALHVYIFSTADSPVSEFSIIAEGIESRTQLLRKEQLATPPKISFEKMHATRYNVQADGITGPFALVLRQRFHPGWEVTSTDNINVTGHAIADGYANGWIVTPQENQKNIEFTLEFTPQKNTRRTAVLSLLTLCGSLLYLFITKTRKVVA